MSLYKSSLTGLCFTLLVADLSSSVLKWRETIPRQPVQLSELRLARLVSEVTEDQRVSALFVLFKLCGLPVRHRVEEGRCRYRTVTFPAFLLVKSLIERFIQELLMSHLRQKIDFALVRGTGDNLWQLVLPCDLLRNESLSFAIVIAASLSDTPDRGKIICGCRQHFFISI